jgi:hypothetical protein
MKPGILRLLKVNRKGMQVRSGAQCPIFQGSTHALQPVEAIQRQISAKTTSQTAQRNLARVWTNFSTIAKGGG